MIRFIKIFLKNLHRLRPKYLHLICSNNGLISRDTITNNNIFLITSCINTCDSDEYVNHNLTFSPKDRLAETLVGLKSIHTHYPSRYIIFLESSELSAESERAIKPLVDEYHNYHKSRPIQIARQHFNKGVPQFTALVKFIEENKGHYCAEVFHFLGARYMLKGPAANNETLPGAYFLYYPKSRNVSTRYFFIRNGNLSDIRKPFRYTLYCAILGSSVEDIIYRFFHKPRFIGKLNICGKVNGVEMVHE